MNSTNFLASEPKSHEFPDIIRLVFFKTWENSSYIFFFPRRLISAPNDEEIDV